MNRKTGVTANWIAGTATVAYASVYAWLGIVRYRSYHASCDDGLFGQTIASAFHGFSNTPESASHFAFHFSPILYAIAPLLWTTRSPIALIIVQAVAGALVVPAIYLIARQRLPALPAAGVAVVAALYPPLGGISFTEFSENAFAPAAAAWLLWALDVRRMVWAVCFALLCLSIKEDQALILATLGVLGAIYFGRRGETAWMRWCIALTIVSTMTIALYVAVVRPSSGVWYAYPALRDYYGGESPLELLAGVFTGPKLLYVLEVLAPIVGLCLLSPCMILAMPGLTECLLSRMPVAYTIGSHHAATWVPYVLVAFALGTARVWKHAPRAALIALAASFAISGYINVAASPNHWSANLAGRSPADRAVDAFIATLPSNASIASFCQVYAHLGMYPKATVYPASLTQYVVLYPARDDAQWDTRERRYIITKSAYRLLRHSDGVEVYGLR